MEIGLYMLVSYNQLSIEDGELQLRFGFVFFPPSYRKIIFLYGRLETLKAWA